MFQVIRWSEGILVLCASEAPVAHHGGQKASSAPPKHLLPTTVVRRRPLRLRSISCPWLTPQRAPREC